MTPTINEADIPDVCLSLRVQSDWGHFKKYGRTASKQTYSIIPRTAVAGLLAGIVGVGRDQYYDTFGEGTSAIAITPQFEVRTINIPTTGIGTDPSSSAAKKAKQPRARPKRVVTYHDTTQHRQIHNYEVLVNPAYRIDVAVEDEEFYGELRAHLSEGTSIYPPSMGLSEYLASVEYLGEFEVTQAQDNAEIDSVVPTPLADVVPQPNVSYRIERSPAIMGRYRGGRRTTRFDDLVFTTKREAQIQVATDEITPCRVDDTNVVFR